MRSADYLLHPIRVAVCLDPASGGPVASSSEHPIAATLVSRSGGFRFLVPASPRLSAAARLVDFGRADDKPDTMDRDGRETTKEAI